MTNPFHGYSDAYRIIYADPPWSYYGDPTKDQAAGKHYQLMSTEDICALPVPRLVGAGGDAALFLWCTGPKLDQGLQVLRAWDFHYRGIAYIWIKTTRDGKIISGQGVRPTFVKQMAELVLVGSTNPRGRPFPIHTESQSQYVFAPRPQGIHSRKPKEVRRRIVELCGDLPRIELFARKRVRNWDAWGNEVTPKRQWQP